MSVHVVTMLGRRRVRYVIIAAILIGGMILLAVHRSVSLLRTRELRRACLDLLVLVHPNNEAANIALEAANIALEAANIALHGLNGLV